MPTYTFECEKCGQPFDLKRPMSEAGAPATCPDDGSPAHRLYNAGAVQRSGFRDRHAVRLDSGGSFDKEAAADRGKAADARADKAGMPRAPGHGD